MNTTTVIAHVKAKPGQEDAVRVKLLSLVAPSRQDAGCLGYDLHQAADHPANFIFYENWTSRAELDAHLQQAHVQSVLTSLGSLVAEPPQITFWHKLS